MSPDFIRAGGISVNLEQCTARAGRRVLRLTLTEYNLLVCLLRNPGRVLSRRQLLDAAWGRKLPGWRADRGYPHWTAPEEAWAKRGNGSRPCVEWATSWMRSGGDRVELRPSGYDTLPIVEFLAVVSHNSGFFFAGRALWRPPTRWHSCPSPILMPVWVGSFPIR